MKSLAIRLLLLLAVCAFFAPLVHADDSEVFDTGTNVYPINNDNIRMVSEKVTIIRKKVLWVIQDKKYIDGASVDCEFLFENTTDEAQTVKVGFPGVECVENSYFCHTGLNNFISYIDGEEVPVTVKEEITGTLGTYYKEDKDGKRVPVERYRKRNWYTWDVNFPPRSKVRLRNTYNTKLSYDSIGHKWYKYILVTGANWKGPIGSATIEVIYEDEDYFRRRVGKIEPGGYEIQGSKIIWELKEFTPQEDIEILEISDWRILINYLRYFESYFDIRKYEGAERLYTVDDLKNPITPPDEELAWISWYPLISRDMMEEESDRIYVKILRREICARLGKNKAGYGLLQFRFNFNNVSWNKDPGCSDKQLTNIERQNIKFIEDYERARGWR